MSCISKNKKEMKLRKRTAARFEENLDIRSFVSVRTNLALLLSLLLTNEQLLLFQHHRAHAILEKESNKDKDHDHKKDIVKRAIGSC